MHIIFVQAAFARHMDNNNTGKQEQLKTDFNILLYTKKIQI